MAKHDHLSQLKGRSFYGDDQNTRRGKLHSLVKYVEVNPIQAKVINRFIISETAFFNALVDRLNARLKGTPEFYLELTDLQIELFSELAYLNFNVESLAGKLRKDTPIPKRLHPYVEILFGCHGDKEIGISEKLRVFYEVFARPATLLPAVKKRMATTLIEFCIEQAGSGSMNYYDGKQNHQFKQEALNQVTTLQKRHVQLHKDDVEVVWNAQEEQTEITIPYTKKPLIIELLDLNEFYPDWNVMILHQDTHDLVTADSEWEIEFKTTKQQYLYKYLECPDPSMLMKSRGAGRRSY